MKIHIVQKGDTLWEISKEYGVDFEELKQTNSHISSPDMIMPGMKIKIPSSTKQVKKEMGKAPVKKEEKKMEMKPKPFIKEDDNAKPKEVKPTLPMQPMSTMEQNVHQHMTFNYPEEPKKEETMNDQMQMNQEKEQYSSPQKEQVPAYHQPMPMQPMCCHMIHPCCCKPMHFNQMHMMPLHAPGQHMGGNCSEPYPMPGPQMMQGASGMHPGANLYPAMDMPGQMNEMGVAEIPQQNMQHNHSMDYMNMMNMGNHSMENPNMSNIGNYPMGYPNVTNINQPMGNPNAMNMENKQMESYPSYNQQYRTNPTPPNFYSSINQPDDL
ncbi:SafA/ExsA family spore coat assembly protein [Virgibacillus sp. W0181]|uniref:SafA/ExsA family spore coat assembly protein n=1 Tax=Virgibacillus sp. W0181 TaxID=3391581 RepID=UPI003F45DE6D